VLAEREIVVNTDDQNALSRQFTAQGIPAVIKGGTIKKGEE
jgi:hypothetical protein